MSDFYLTWSDYYSNIEQLAVKIYHSDWKFNQIVCLARGGLRVGDILSRIYRLPLAILSASSYGGLDNRSRGDLIFSSHLAMTQARLGSHVLLVDDMVDSGITLRESVVWLKQHYGDRIEEIRTAVIWYKACSAYAPDYYLDHLPDDPWIHQPFELYERMNIAEVAASYAAASNSKKPQP